MIEKSPEWEKFKTGEWTEVNSDNIFPFSAIGDTIVGIYRGKQEGVGRYNQTLYKIETQSGMRRIWGSAILDTQLDRVPIGSPVRIEFLGFIETKKGQQAKNFKVEFIK